MLGENYNGQLGMGNYTRLNIPSEAINLGRKAVAISLGFDHSCAVLENGDVKCWGESHYGQLGTGDNTHLNIPSAPINLGGKAVAISLLGGSTAAQFLKTEKLNAGDIITMGSLEQEIILI